MWKKFNCFFFFFLYMDFPSVKKYIINVVNIVDNPCHYQEIKPFYFWNSSTRECISGGGGAYSAPCDFLDYCLTFSCGCQCEKKDIVLFLQGGPQHPSPPKKDKKKCHGRELQVQEFFKIFKCLSNSVHISVASIVSSQMFLRTNMSLSPSIRK